MLLITSVFKYISPLVLLKSMVESGYISVVNCSATPFLLYLTIKEKLGATDGGVKSGSDFFTLPKAFNCSLLYLIFSPVNSPFFTNPIPISSLVGNLWCLTFCPLNKVPSES